MNVVSLVGNLCTDTHQRQTQSGKDITTFKLAVDRPGKDAGADFVWVKTWNGTAKACAQYLSKGSPVAVQGELRTSQKRDADGNVVQEYVEVNARLVKFLSRRNDNGEMTESEHANLVGNAPDIVASDTEPPSEDDIPF